MKGLLLLLVTLGTTAIRLSGVRADTRFEAVDLSASKRIESLNAVKKSERSKDALTWVGGWHLIGDAASWFGGISSVIAGARFEAGSGALSPSSAESVRLLTITVRRPRVSV